MRSFPYGYRQVEVVMIRILIATDGHYGAQFNSSSYIDGGEYPCEFRHETMMGWINAEANANGLDFVVFNGDNWNNTPYAQVPEGHGGEGEYFCVRTRYWYDQLKPVNGGHVAHDPSKGSVLTYYASHGNHDRWAAFGGSGFVPSYEDFFGHPVNHSFSYGGYGFILLNSGSEGAVDVGYGTGYDLPSYLFLKNSVDSFMANDMPVIVFCHVDWNSFQYLGGATQSGYFGECAPHHALCASNPYVLAVVHGHRHTLPIILEEDTQTYHFACQFSHRNGGPEAWGYRIIELPERS